MTDLQKPEIGQLGLSYTLNTQVIDGGVIEQTLMIGNQPDQATQG